MTFDTIIPREDIISVSFIGPHLEGRHIDSRQTDVSMVAIGGYLMIRVVHPGGDITLMSPEKAQLRLKAPRAAEESKSNSAKTTSKAPRAPSSDAVA